jgi:pimeloyl-ACP methyl ester carboxylesterase
MMRTEGITLKTITGDLFGTLELPSQTPPVPVALIIAGSGPTDRDGNSAGLPGKNDSLKMLASGLALQGIASLRYDKRGIAASAAAKTDEADIRFETMIADAVSWLQMLQTDPRFDEIVVIGHSEGSLIGMAAAKEAGIDGFISLEGAGYPASQILMTQLKTQLTPPLLASVETIINQLTAGEAVTTLPEPISQVPALAAMFRDSIQPYLISWFQYDPAQTLATLSIPILIIQGTADLQVSQNDADRLLEANPSAKLALIENMNHVCKMVPANDQPANLAAYSNPDLPLADGLIDTITSFVMQIPVKEI